jgi:hypothetical protein
MQETQSHIFDAFDKIAQSFANTHKNIGLLEQNFAKLNLELCELDKMVKNECLQRYKQLADNLKAVSEELLKEHT